MFKKMKFSTAAFLRKPTVYQRFLPVLALGVMLCAPAAQAEVFVWQDPASGASISFPDRWERVTNKNPGDVLTIRAPGALNFAECRLNVQPEGRFKIYPAAYDPEIQRTEVSVEYWEQFFTLYDNVVLAQVTDNAGLGRGFGSYATAGYQTSKGALLNKKAVAFASYYNREIYAIECSAEQSAYDQWSNTFLSIVKSVDFKKPSAGNYNGYYRDFMGDKKLRVRGATVLDDTYH